MGASSTHTPESHAQGGHPTVRHAVESMLLEERTRWAMQIHDGLTQSVTSAVLELQIAPAPDRDRSRGGRRGDRAHRERDPRRPPADPRAAVRDDERDARLERARARRAGPRSGRTLAAPGFDRGGGRCRGRGRGNAGGRPRDRQRSVRERGEALRRARGARRASTLATARCASKIEDRGRGIVPVPDDDPHFGVRIMRARAEALGGYLDVESTPGHGTTVVAVLPVARTGG